MSNTVTVDVRAPEQVTRFQQAIDRAVHALHVAERLAITPADHRTVADGWLALAALLR